METQDRAPHAVLDLASRRQKGLKIERLLGLVPDGRPLRLLEIGTGSGGIAHYFATHQTLRCDVIAVDVVDQRLARDGYAFQEVRDTKLPFADGCFDVVISNHVIEHVGRREAQLEHLREVCRVMSPDAVTYLAVPNRWMLIEPHYRLAFLSWLPHGWRSPYLRMRRRGQRYDCEPLELAELDALIDEAGLKARHLEVEALRAMVEIESASTFARLLAALPQGWLARMRPVIPTLICCLRRSQP